MPWSAVARVLQPAVLELVDQEGDAFVAVAAVRVAGVREEADQRLVELHALGLLRAVGRHRALGALRRDRAGAVGQQQADQRLEGEQVVVARRAGRAARRTRPRPGSARPASPRCAMPQKRPASCCDGIGRSADQRAEQLQPPGQALGRERARCACAISGPQASVAADRRQHARLRSDGPAGSRASAGTPTGRRAPRTPASRASARASGASAASRPGWSSSVDLRDVEALAQRGAELVAQPGRMEALDHELAAPRAPPPAASARRWRPPRPAPRWAHCRPRGWPAPPPAPGGRAG